MLMLPVVNKAVFVSPSWCFNSRLSVCLVGRTQEPHPGLWDFPVLLVHKTTNRPASTTLNVKKKTEKYSHFSLWFKRFLSQLSRQSKLLSFETVWRRDYWVNTKWAISLVYMLKPLITLIVATNLVFLPLRCQRVSQQIQARIDSVSITTPGVLTIYTIQRN